MNSLDFVTKLCIVEINTIFIDDVKAIDDNLLCDIYHEVYVCTNKHDRTKPVRYSINKFFHDFHVFLLN